MNKNVSDNMVSDSMSKLLQNDQSGIINLEDVRKLYEIMEKEKIISTYTLPTHKSSDNYYHVWVSSPTAKGGRKQLKAKTLEELKEKVYAHEKGISGRTLKTFKDVFEIVQDEKLKYVKSDAKKKSVQNTILRNRSEYARFIANTEIENKYITDITKRDLEDVIMLNLTRYELKKKGVQSLKSILNSVFQLAYNESWVKNNVYSRIDFKKFEQMIVEATPIEERVHTDEELARIIKMLHEKQLKSPEYLPAYALELQIIMGLRRGEIPPLLWSDITRDYVSITKEQITIKKSMYSEKERFQIVDHTKTSKNRRYPRSEAVEDLLSRLRAVHDAYGIKSPYLFPADSENGVITNNTVYDFYRRICKKLGIQISREYTKGPHSFRRNAVTNVVNASDGNILMASQLFGNSPEVAKNNYYTGLDMKKALEILNKKAE